MSPSSNNRSMSRDVPDDPILHSDPPPIYNEPTGVVTSGRHTVSTEVVTLAKTLKENADAFQIKVRDLSVQLMEKTKSRHAKKYIEEIEERLRTIKLRYQFLDTSFHFVMKRHCKTIEEQEIQQQFTNFLDWAKKRKDDLEEDVEKKIRRVEQNMGIWKFL